jgi:hypothetical protein
MSATSAAVALIARVRARGAGGDWRARLARQKRVPEADLSPAEIDRYWRNVAGHIAGAFLDSLNDEEWRLEHDQEALVDCPPDEVEEATERLEGALRETRRRAGLPPRPTADTGEVWVTQLDGLRWTGGGR